jgi:hypothetical protein
MVVKSATKKKLMDLGCPEPLAHKWADDRKWHHIREMNFDDIMSIFPYTSAESIYEIVMTIRENELKRVGQMEEMDLNALAAILNYPEDYRNEPFIADYPPSWCDNCNAYEPLIDGYCQTCEPSIAHLRETMDYRQKIGAFGMIPNGSPYSYLLVNSQNFMNWLSENPFRIK